MTMKTVRWCSFHFYIRYIIAASLMFVTMTLMIGLYFAQLSDIEYQWYSWIVCNCGLFLSDTLQIVWFKDMAIVQWRLCRRDDIYNSCTYSCWSDNSLYFPVFINSWWLSWYILKNSRKFYFNILIYTCRYRLALRE